MRLRFTLRGLETNKSAFRETQIFPPMTQSAGKRTIGLGGKKTLTEHDFCFQMLNKVSRGRLIGLHICCVDL